MKQLVIVGEVFWDLYEDGSIFLGGSSLNVAWHLKGLGLDPLLLSRLGNDDFGKKMIRSVQGWGMSTDYLQVDDQHSTGVIKVILDDQKKPTFITPPDVAMDYIEYDQAVNAIQKNAILWHGSFVLRNEKSRATLKKLKNKLQSTFMDLNLRPPYWTHQLLDEWTRDLEILKLSDEEFDHMSQKTNLSVHDRIDWLQNWMRSRNIQNVLYTCGPEGSYWVRENEIFFAEAQKIEPVDTVGAGDAFCSGIMFSQSLGLSPQESIERSSRFSARICMIEGATSPDKSFYQKCRKVIWGL